MYVASLYTPCLWGSVCFCTGHFVMVPTNLTCPHCLQFFFEHLFYLYYTIHVRDIYLLDGVFPSKCSWKNIIDEKTFQRSNSELFHECVANYPTCAPLVLRSDSVSCIWTMTRHWQSWTVVYLQKDNESNWSCWYAKIQEHVLTLYSRQLWSSTISHLILQCNRRP